MNTAIEQLKDNTKFLVPLIKEVNSLLSKVEIVEKIHQNLQVLKQEMNEADFKAEFGDLEVKVEKTISDITNTKFVEDLFDKITKFVKTLQVGSTV